MKEPRKTFDPQTISDITDYMIDQGSESYYQAKFIKEISIEALKSNKPILQQLKPNLKFKNERAWGISYYLIKEFLKYYQMDQVLSIIDLENSLSLNKIQENNEINYIYDLDSLFSMSQKHLIPTFEEQI